MMRRAPNKLRIAILAHSTNPRGGVVHALELGDALCGLGHAAVVHAPDAGQNGFFRQAICETVSVPAAPAGPDTAAMARTRIAEYINYFESESHRQFDIFHAQDGISGNALATLKSRKLIPGFARTIHHIDAFDDPRLAALQRRSITEADRHLVVSHLWQDVLHAEWGIAAELVGNGVDTTRFTPLADQTDDELRTQFGLTSGQPMFLAIGGVEARKNTVQMLQAFRLVVQQFPAARFIIAGGASLLDHDAYQAKFAHALAATGLGETNVLRAGTKIPQRLMPALYRAASALAFASVKEGFGLAVLEAMACGVPVVTSRIAPFTEYLGPDDAFWCDPTEISGIAGAMISALDPARRSRVITRGFKIAERHDWASSARTHLALYETLMESANA